MPGNSISHTTMPLNNAHGKPLSIQVWEPLGQTMGGVSIVHGLGDHASRLSHVARTFATAGYLVFAHDQIGHGNTIGRRGHIGQFEWLIDDIEMVVEALKNKVGTAPVFLYGQSLGGSLVLSYSIRRKPEIDGVIASSPLLLPAQPLPPWKIGLGQLLSFVWPSFRFANGLDAADLSHDPEVAAAYRSDPLVHDRVSARLAVKMLAEGRWLAEHAPESELPTLLLHGTGDRITCCDASVQFARLAGERCTMKTWPGLFHELHQETDKDEVLAFVVQWMKKIGP